MYTYVSRMHSGERLNKLSAQFIEYAALRANDESGHFLELESCSRASIYDSWMLFLIRKYSIIC